MITASPPALPANYRVHVSTVSGFRADGHAVTHGLITREELTCYRSILLNSVNRLNAEKRRMEERDTYGKAFLQIMNLWEFEESVRPFVLARRFGSVAAQLMGVDRVRLYHDQALFKEPGGGATPWHQDQYYWPLDTNNMVTMWMPLVDVSVDMGMLTFASGSHSGGLVKNVAISDESDTALDDYVKKKGYVISRPDFLNAGEATWHYGLTLHHAPGNQTEVMREVMTIIYFADGARVTPPRSEHQEADRQRWLGGIQPGELAAGVLNPLI